MSLIGELGATVDRAWVESSDRAWLFRTERVFYVLNVRSDVTAAAAIREVGRSRTRVARVDDHGVRPPARAAIRAVLGIDPLRRSGIVRWGDTAMDVYGSGLLYAPKEGT